MNPVSIRAIEMVRRAKASQAVRRAFQAPHPVLIATAPKTGSTSLEIALADAGIPPIKIHFPLRDAPIAMSGWHGKGLPAPHHFFLEAAVRKRRSRGNHGPLRVLTLIRDPVAQAVSSAFQLVATGRNDAGVTEDFVDLARSQVRKHAIEGRNARWFSGDFEPWIGIDVLSAPFDRATGATRLSGFAGDVLFMKTEALDRLDPSLSDFLGASISTKRNNVRSDTSMADLYVQVRDRMRLSSQTLDDIYGQPLYRHVYSPEEIAAFRARWSNDR